MNKIYTIEGEGGKGNYNSQPNLLQTIELKHAMGGKGGWQRYI